MKAIRITLMTIVFLAVLSIFASQSETQAATDVRDAKIVFSAAATADTHDALLVAIKPAYTSDNAPVLHRLNDCVPYARSMTTFTGGYSHNVILRHGNCDAVVTKTRVERSTEPTSPIVEPTVTETTETPVVVPPVDDKPETPADTCANANPGNTKCVGKAGENPNGKDTMPLDNDGGNGNGEHGNQGQGGNSDHSN